MVSNKKYHLVLASMSPRRRELLAHLNIPFSIYTPETDEISDEKTPSRIAIDIARAKGREVLQRIDGVTEPFILSADTIVILNDEILGKPKDSKMAKEYLQKLSGKKHQVITAVAFLTYDGEHSFFVQSDVTFDKIAPEILENYLATGESLDKAGAYGIQGPALTFISSVNGSYSNVVGFPLSDIVRELRSFLKIDESDQISGSFK